ncbi:hypothetical protein [Mesobacillus jeotgali]|jgi:hypothetical protein|uniref:hypothetical protein n=1 Tax=Mesobacillus jeotgali TaxID=129985 RepID=UPI00177AEB90|nr:hypothetical protein [Mesobacillus jeotgali]UYZ23286.1 hypothetical protein FOF60_07005 [Mesobacillus jeotgali]
MSKNKSASNESKKERGRPSSYTDVELKEIALEIKNKFKGQKLTYLLLEKQTGIGRNTWSRRIPETIEELNKPIKRPLGLTEKDEVYFPNIEQIFDIYKNDKNKIINELHYIETAFYELYNEVRKYKEALDNSKDMNEEIKIKDEEIKQLKEQVKHYEHLYNSQMISSAFSHLRDEKNLKDNLIKFDHTNKNHSTLENLDTFFKVTETAPETQCQKNNNLSTMENRFSNIFKK